METREADANGSLPADTQPGSELWRHPSPKTTQIWEFLERTNAEHSLQSSTYQELYQWSIDNVNDFWAAAWRYVGIRASKDFEKVACSLQNPPALDPNKSAGDRE